MISKKSFLTLSIVGTCIFFLTLFAPEVGLCNFVKDSCTSLFDPIAETFAIFVIVLTFVIIIYKMHDEIYQSWFKFARIWIPLSMLAIYLAPEYAHDWMYPIEKGTVAFMASLLFIIISVALIIYKRFFGRKIKT